MMRSLRIARRLVFVSLLLPSLPCLAQQAENPPPSPAPVASGASTTAPTVSMGRHDPAEPEANPARRPSDSPVVLVPANSDEATIDVVLHDLKEAPAPADLSVGLLVNAAQPKLLTRPTLTLLEVAPVPDRPGDYSARLRVQGLFAFGDSRVPLLYRGVEVASLHFSKPGLLLKPSRDGSPVAREGASTQFPLVLENPSGFAYKSVRARLRFDDRDLCTFTAEDFSSPAAPLPKQQSCTSYPNWSRFELPRYAEVTLLANPPSEWFRDPASRFAHSGKKSGWLTVRFEGASDGSIYEQNLPIEVQFEPSTWSLFQSLLYVALFLVAGAGLSLLLRVSVPNIKRKRALKDQLNELGKLTASISTEVESTLRVLLRVERLALDEIRQAAYSFGPGYFDYALRVEQSLPTLKRRIDAVRRLDATLIRQRLMMEQNPAPTRLEQIESHLEAVSETLKQDNLSEEDWVFVNQHLEAAQKLLREPTQADKEAFSAMLSGRWKAISQHFKLDGQGRLIVPHALEEMAECFPQPSLLPEKDDKDGAQWVRDVGPTRADLQLYALALIWEFEFLMPSATQRDDKWADARRKLSVLLGTPVVNNLRAAKSLLRQLAEDITETDIKGALQNGRATIVMDPAVPRPNQRIRFSVRFSDARLNLSAARALASCRWTFVDQGASWLERMGRRIPVFGPRWLDAAGHNYRTLTLHEEGWTVHHYFEKDIECSTISVLFNDSEGNPIPLAAAVVVPPGNPPATAWFERKERVEASRRPQERWARAWLEVFQLIAALLVPLATLATQTINEASVGNWWQLIAIGFASDTIKSILVGRQESPRSS